MSRLLAPTRPSPIALALLVLAALAVGLAGFEHARLFHRGYAQVDVVGPLFWLNGLASMLTVVALVFERVLAFVAGSLSISAGSVVSILISHSSSFFGFSEGGYDTVAAIILAAEIAAVLLTLAAIAVGALRAPGATTGAAA